MMLHIHAVVVSLCCDGCWCQVWLVLELCNGGSIKDTSKPTTRFDMVSGLVQCLFRAAVMCGAISPHWLRELAGGLAQAVDCMAHARWCNLPVLYSVIGNVCVFYASQHPACPTLPIHLQQLCCSEQHS